MANEQKENIGRNIQVSVFESCLKKASNSMLQDSKKKSNKNPNLEMPLQEMSSFQSMWDISI